MFGGSLERIHACQRRWGVLVLLAGGLTPVVAASILGRPVGSCGTTTPARRSSERVLSAQRPGPPVGVVDHAVERPGPGTRRRGQVQSAELP